MIHNFLMVIEDLWNEEYDDEEDDGNELRSLNYVADPNILEQGKVKREFLRGVVSAFHGGA